MVKKLSTLVYLAGMAARVVVEPGRDIEGLFESLLAESFNK